MPKKKKDKDLLHENARKPDESISTEKVANQKVSFNYNIYDGNDKYLQGVTYELDTNKVRKLKRYLRIK
jgi:hypothetical protein